MFFDMSEFETQAIAIDQQYRTAVDALARRDDLLQILQIWQISPDALARRDDLTMPGKVARSALSWQRFGSKRATVILISWRRCCTI